MQESASLDLMSEAEQPQKSVSVAVLPGQYALLTSQIESDGEARTIAVVMPHPPVAPGMALMVAAELASVHKLVSSWVKPSEQWRVSAADHGVELYVPPPPGDEVGTLMGLDEEGAEALIKALAQALATIRAARQLGEPA